MLNHCIKRDGSLAKFEKHRIQNAISKAFEESKEGNKYIAQQVTESVIERLMREFPYSIPTVESIQDFVEDTLMNLHFRQTAKKYILYRDLRNRERAS